MTEEDLLAVFLRDPWPELPVGNRTSFTDIQAVIGKRVSWLIRNQMAELAGHYRSGLGLLQLDQPDIIKSLRSGAYD